MKTKLTKRNVKPIAGCCDEARWGQYDTQFEFNSLYGISLDMPALPERTYGRNVISFYSIPVTGGWLFKSRYHNDTIFLNIELSSGSYYYCDDKHSYELNIEWHCHFDLEKKLRSLHRKMFLTSSQPTNIKKAA